MSQNLYVLALMGTWLLCNGDNIVLNELLPPGWDTVKSPVSQKPYGENPHGQKPGLCKAFRNMGYGQKPGWSKAPQSKSPWSKARLVKSPIKQANKHLNFKTNLFDIYTYDISESLPSDAVSNALQCLYNMHGTD